ncbi:MAG TPA: primosomal protein N' [Vicinamibacterales bacterium]|nr:primosomal protein N' [Vicinamibacterales bacterium]
MRAVRVAVPVPALDGLTYSVPDGFVDPPPGARVLVPLGNRVVTGCVLPPGSAGGADNRDHRPAAQPGAGPRSPSAGNGAAPEAAPIRPLLDLLDVEAFLPDDVVRLAAWVAEYYACGIGEAIAAAMPPRAWVESERHAQITERGHGQLLIERGLRRELLERLAGGRPMRVGSLAGDGRGLHAALTALERDGLVMLTRPLKGAAAAFRTIRTVAPTVQGLEVAGRDGDPAPRLGARQREALAALRGSPAGMDTAILAERGISTETLQRLAALGLVTLGRRTIERDPFDQGSALPASANVVALTSGQTAALAHLESMASRGSFGAALLHGVTGSGKTEIYLRLASIVVRGGGGVLVLVPEIALTPAVAGAFHAAFGRRVAIQHSGLSDGERYDQWHRIRRGEVDVVVGTRSAVFAPVRSLGLIIVDEEHDGSYKQEESPRYNGRDVAVMRARRAGALVVLGSATPSMESYQNALNGRYALVTMDRRVLERPLAEVAIVDMRAEYATAGPGVILSGRLQEALGERLARREQAMVLLNRRGYATAVFCRQCAATLECPNCSVSLTVHRAARRARCHYCNHSMPVPKACLNCAGPYLEQTGFGTERVEAEILAHFPGARVARVDRDTMRKRGAIAELLARFASGAIDVLVGTQMIAKGHDFPRVTLVGVVSADVGLGHADFRASERTFQLLTQVAGRAGRGEARGQAIVQTIYPDHYSIRHACRQDYAAFFSDEINYRRSMRYPPAVALVNLVVKGRTLAAAMDDAGAIVRSLRSAGDAYRVLGPAMAPLSRLKGEHRAQLFLKGTHRAAMRRAVAETLAAMPEVRRRTVVDVDPMNVL